MHHFALNTTTVIDDATLLAGIMHKQKPSILSPHFWHKIFVKNAEGESRDLVLQALMDAVHPHDFIPVHYEATGDGTVSFLVKNCGQAILQFCELNLTVAHPQTAKNYPPFRLTIVLRDKHSTKFKVDIQQNITTILKRRFIQNKRSLDLEQFHLDRELTEFCPLSQPKLLYFVLHLARDLDVAQLKLANNDIEILKPFEVLFADKNAKNLVSIDLRKNKVKSMEEVGIMKTFPLVELYLEDNPICNEFKEHEYIKNISTLFPNLAKLDGCRINPNGMVPLRRNFVCSYSAVELVDRFMEHYFNLYDSPDRAVLECIYHAEAVFSLTSQFLAGQTSSLKSKLVDFQKIGHNIKQISDYSKIDDAVFVGPQDIIKVLTSLPSTEHDPFTFTVDLTYFQEKVVILTITGVFKHLGENLRENDYLYNFMRTFMLKEGDEGEYKIVNEIMNVTNATSLAHLRSFKVSRAPKATAHVNISPPKSEEERLEVVETFVVLTNMKREWSRKCLKECDYDLKKSLSMFIDLFKADKLPLHAFNSIETFETSHIQKRPTTTNSQLSVNSNQQTEDANIQSPTKSNLIAPIIVESERTIEKEEEDYEFYDDFAFTEGRRKMDYVKDMLSSCDKPLMDALTMPKNTPKDKANVLLVAATKHLVTYYKDNLYYYKMIGMMCYRFGFLDEARSLLDLGRTSLTSDEFNILDNVFLIFEMQHAPEVYVDKLVQAKIAKEPLTDVLNLLTRDAVRAGAHHVRSLFTRMTTFGLDEEKLLQLIIAYHDYELLVGSDANIAQYQAFANKYFPSHKLCSMKLYYNTKTLYPPITEPIPKLKESGRTLAEFRHFRAAILGLVGIFNDEIDDPEVRHLVKFTGPDASLLAMCDGLVDKYKERFVIVKIVCRKLWERDLHDDIKKLFEKVKEFSDKQLLDNLILLYKIKTDLLLGNENEIMAKLKLHVNVIPIVQLLNFLEDLTNEDNIYISKIFESFLNDPLITFEKKRFMALEYKVFSLKMRDPGIMKSAEDFVRRWFVAFEAFHYGETLKCLETMKIPFDTSILPLPVLSNLAQRYLEDLEYSFMAGLQVILKFFLRNFRKLARDTRRRCLLKLAKDEDLHFKFSIISSIMEARYGDVNRAQRDLVAMEKEHGKNMNYICPLAECYVLNKDFKNVRNTLLPHILDINFIMDPEIQKVMFMYFNHWKNNLRVDVLPKILCNAEEPAGAPAKVVKVKN